MSLRSVPVAALLAPLLLLAATPADASAVCERLNARLANLPRMVSSNADLRDYTGAISRQNIDLRRARSDRRRLGCGSGSMIVVGGANEEACAGVNEAIARMEDNLDALKARRQHLVSGGDTAVQRRRILAALDVNRCAEEEDELMRAAAGEPEAHRNILEDLPPVNETYRLRRRYADGFDFGTYDGGGGLRTLCVRTCDGAFFPISSNASPADFERDTEACERRCPGTETMLYYHALTTEETDEMISAATGEPYTSLPTAFAYKTRDPDLPGQCGCAPTGTTAARQSEPESQSAIITIGEPEKTEPAAKRQVPVRPYDPQNSKIRVVGPSFLPSQESSIDLKNPAGPAYQQQQQTN